MSIIRFTVRAIIPEGSGALSIVFNSITHDRTVIHYQAGQRLMVYLNLNNRSYGKAYWFSSSPLVDALPQITVIPTFGDPVDRYMCNRVKVSDSFDVLLATDYFAMPILETSYRRYFLLAEKEGIVPIFSLLKSLLVSCPHSDIYLLYGAAKPSSRLFAEPMKALQQQAGSRLQVQTLVERDDVKETSWWPSWQDLFLPKQKPHGWTGILGPLDHTRYLSFLLKYDAGPQDYFINCGSMSAIDMARHLLEHRGIKPYHIYQEPVKLFD